jgi:glyoxylase-like metal-dependent hydrolase (beta-lactamase superfamily II)
MAAATGVSSFHGGDDAMVMDGKFTIKRLSECVFQVVEGDRFGQLPFAYAIVGADKIVVVDTGTGSSGNLCEVLDRQLNPSKLPYALILTHNHFDHAGGAASFAGRCSGIFMGGKSPTYSKNLEVTSLAMGVGVKLRPFEVTGWLKDGDSVWLDDANPCPWNELRVYWTPGHAIDHIAVLFVREKRLFVGDTLYPFTAIDLANMGSNVKDYASSIKRIREIALEQDSLAPPSRPTSTKTTTAVSSFPGDTVVASEQGDGPTKPITTAVTSVPKDDTVVASEDGHEEMVRSLVTDWLGMSLEEVREHFDPHTLLQVNDWDMERAVNMFHELGDAVSDVAPPYSSGGGLPKATSASSSSSHSSGKATDLPFSDWTGPTTLACGHVDPAWRATTACEEVLTFLELVRSGAVEASSSEGDGIGEFRGGNISIVMPVDALGQ